MRSNQKVPLHYFRPLLLAAAIVLVLPMSAIPQSGESTTNSNLTAQTETSEKPADETNEALRVSLQLQEQIHEAKIALQKNQEQQAALEKEVSTRLKTLEETVQKQRAAELDNMQTKIDTLRRDLDTNGRTLLYVGGGIALIGFMVLLATGYLQWRSVNRLAEFSALVQSVRALPAPPTAAESQLLGATATAQSNGRLFSALTDLEKRINELEHTTHPVTEAKVISHESHGNGTRSGQEHPNGAHDSVLLAKGQSLLNMDKPEEALACFEEILKTEPSHGEALVKKGLALEALDKSDEALKCYDQAISGNSDLTIAYLQKGGLFNRLERYEEALQCYELALRAQEKAHQI